MAETITRMTHVLPDESVPGWTGGDVVRCKARGEDTGGRYALFELVSPPGTGSPPHVHHREDEALYVLRGEYEITDFNAGTTITAPAGAYVFLPCGTRHAFRNPGPDEARLLVLATPAGLEGFFEEIGRATGRDDALAIAERYGIELQ